MDSQVFSDGIGQVTIVGSTVRLDFVAYSPTEKDAKGQPLAVFCQRIILSPEGFLRSAEKVQESVQALSKLAQVPRVVPAPEPRAELPVMSVAPTAPEPAAAAAEPQPTPAARPFP